MLVRTSGWCATRRNSSPPRVRSGSAMPDRPFRRHTGGSGWPGPQVRGPGRPDPETRRRPPRSRRTRPNPSPWTAGTRLQERSRREFTVIGPVVPDPRSDQDSPTSRTRSIRAAPASRRGGRPRRRDDVPRRPGRGAVRVPRHPDADIERVKRWSAGRVRRPLLPGRSARPPRAAGVPRGAHPTTPDARTGAHHLQLLAEHVAPWSDDPARPAGAGRAGAPGDARQEGCSE